MKTTIDIPAPLYRRAKIRAAERGESLKKLVIDALQRSLDASPRGSGISASGEDPLFTTNEFGFPILRGRDGVIVTEEIVNRIREEEGI
jgi:hypothetical protein